MPDIESPETVPVYLTAVEPTVPNLIEPPSTVPFTGTVPDVDSVILPCSFDPACSQLSVNVPENVPPYLPVHLPDRPPDCCEVEPSELELDGMVPLGGIRRRGIGFPIAPGEYERQCDNGHDDKQPATIYVRV